MGVHKLRPGYGSTFYVPLTEEQFGWLGKIASTFGQIENQIDRLIAGLTGLEDADLLEAVYDGKQFGSKVTLLKKLNKLIKPHGGEAIARLCQALDDVAPDRNHAIHGQWGLFSPDGSLEPSTGIPAAYSPKRGIKPLYATELEWLCERTQQAARYAFEAIEAVWPRDNTTELPLHLHFGAVEDLKPLE